MMMRVPKHLNEAPEELHSRKIPRFCHSVCPHTLCEGTAAVVLWIYQKKQKGKMFVVGEILKL